MVDLKKRILLHQKQASDPDVNVWVNASAGAGKTKVLIDRMLRLLLRNVPSKTILCLTFTQAAALEMQQRLLLYLERWVTLPDDALKQDLIQLDSSLTVSENLILHARSLFNKILDEPVHIQTLHGFSQQILFSGAEEINLPFGLQLMDDVNRQRMIELTIRHMFESLTSNPYFKDIYTMFSRSKLKDILYKIIDEQAFFRFMMMDGMDAFENKLKTYLHHPPFEKDILDDISSYLDHLSVSGLKTANNIDEREKDFIRNLLDGIEKKQFDVLLNLLLTQKGEVRKRILSKKMTDFYPDEAAELKNLAEKVFDCHQQIKTRKIFDATCLVAKLANEFIHAYQHIKMDHAVLDYDDLIFKTLEIISNPENATQLLYKLDTSIHHMLIDEAQDTNIYQWKLIDSILESFFQSDQDKSIFVVGDHKQSIFGFQGTDPDIFQTIKNYYQEKPSQRIWKDVDLDISFRSLDAILKFVDAIFEYQPLIVPYAAHAAFRGKGGNIVIHPLVTVSEELTEQTIYPTFANQIVDQIERILQQNPAVAFKDILILIRKRGEHLDALQHVLRERNIPFSAPVRQYIDENLLVKFLMYTINCMTQPLDHLNCLEWLSHPWIGSLAKGFSAAADAVIHDIPLNDQVFQHPKFLSLRDVTKGYISLQDVYIKLCIWSYENLPTDDHDMQNALMVLEFLKTWEWGASNPSFAITEFSHHLLSLKVPQLNRTAEDAVRILTVHGSKGLQAPVVMLIDTTSMPITKTVWANTMKNDLFLCSPSSKDETIDYQQLKDHQKEQELKEYYRLLYVALTRAENELHIWGCSKGSVSKDCWYEVCTINKQKGPLS